MRLWTLEQILANPGILWIFYLSYLDGIWKSISRALPASQALSARIARDDKEALVAMLGAAVVSAALLGDQHRCFAQCIHISARG